MIHIPTYVPPAEFPGHLPLALPRVWLLRDLDCGCRVHGRWGGPTGTWWLGHPVWRCELHQGGRQA